MFYIDLSLFILSSTGGCVDHIELTDALLKGFEIYNGATVFDPLGLVLGWSALIFSRALASPSGLRDK